MMPARGVGVKRSCGILWVMQQQMLPADRLQVIADLVRERGSVRARDLVDALGVTDETIRRDLARLAEQGVLRRSHGGAIALRPGDETDTSFRLREHAAEKLAIGRRAAELVADGSSIILDSGTTTLGLARALHGKRELVVVTTAVTNAVELVGNPGTTVDHDRRRDPARTRSGRAASSPPRPSAASTSTRSSSRSTASRSRGA